MTNDMIPEEQEKQALREMITLYSAFNEQLQEVKRIQEELMQKTSTIVGYIEETKAKELEFIANLEEKYQRKFSPEDFMQILHD